MFVAVRNVAAIWHAQIDEFETWEKAEKEKTMLLLYSTRILRKVPEILWDLLSRKLLR